MATTPGDGADCGGLPSQTRLIYSPRNLVPPYSLTCHYPGQRYTGEATAGEPLLLLCIIQEIMQQTTHDNNDGAGDVYPPHGFATALGMPKQWLNYSHMALHLAQICSARKSCYHRPILFCNSSSVNNTSKFFSTFSRSVHR